MGVSFAIPIDVAMDVAEQLRTEGRVSRGWLGVMIQEVNRDLAESFGLERPHGALISRVLPDTPAEAGGLREGDVITSFNGQPIERSGELPHYVGRARAGSMADLELVRDGEAMELRLKVGELADLGEGGNRQASAEGGGGRLGLSVVPLNDEELAQLDISGGVRVTNASGAAAEADIRRGDVITRLNHQAVDSPDSLREISEALESGRPVPVLVLRNGNAVYLALHVP